MRTKTILLTAALVAAGVASSMAQSNVYSLNVVGYVNINVGVGYNLITLPLQNADVTSSVNSVLTNSSANGVYNVVPGGSAVYNWTGAGFGKVDYAGDDGNWYDQNFLVIQTNSIPPGDGVFFFLPTLAAQIAQGDSQPTTNLTLTIVGSVLTGTNTYPVRSGYSFYGNFEPIQGDLTTNGLPVNDNCFISIYNGHGYNTSYGLGTNDSSYSGTNIIGNPAPYPVFADQTYSFVHVVAPAVGQGFLYFSGPGNATSWSQAFTVQ